ncbi:Cu(2+)-transporting P-type ATPase [Exophiala oligosperma]
MVIHGPEVRVEDLRRCVEDCGFEATAGKRTAGESAELLRQTKELKTLKNSFYKLARTSSLLSLVNNNSRIFRYLSLRRFSDRLLTPWGTQLICLCLTVLIWGRYGAWMHKSTWARVKRGSMNMNTLVTLSSTLGILLSLLNLFYQSSNPGSAETYWQTTAGLIMVVTAGKYVNALARRTGTKALASLYSLIEETSWVKLSDTKQLIPTSMVRKSDTIRIEPFTIIPCDCYVFSGSSLVNEAIITGESLPKTKKTGDFLLAGTRNGSGSMVAIIHETEQGSFLTQMLNTVEEAIGSKVQVQQNVDIVIRYFVTVIIVLAIFGSVIAFREADSSVLSILARINIAARKAMTILAVSCPCALGLSTPVAITAGVDVARRKGILMVEGARNMEKLNEISHIVMDKTGTVTEGQLHMAACDLEDSWCDRWEELSVLVCAAEERNGVAHPAGLAVFRGCLQNIQSQWRKYKEFGGLKNLEEVVGQGLRCDVDVGDSSWRRICLGNAMFLSSMGIQIVEQPHLQAAKEALNVYVAIDDEFAGVFRLQDKIRSDAKQAIEALQQRGLSVTMATGDVKAEAQRVSSQLGISVLATSALPSEKLLLVEKLQKQGEKVAMIGDGINDAPSLAAADVGIMMAHGKQCLTTGGSVVLLSSQLNSIPALFLIAKETMAQIHFNLVWILVYNVIALSLALGLGASWNLTLTPYVHTSVLCQ